MAMSADITMMGVSRSRLGVSLPLLIGLGAYALTLGFGSGTLGDPDILWHIVTGRWIIAHGAVPHANLYSYTMPDAPWVAHEWLAEPLMAWLYDHFGWHGLVMMAAAGNAATIAIFSRILLRYLEPAPMLIVVAIGWFVLLQHSLARPHILALPLMTAWVGALVNARQHERAPPLVLGLLMVPWVNLHGSFLFALILAGLFSVEAVVAAGAGRRLAAAKPWALFIAIALLATLVTPNGISAWLLPFHLLDMKYTLSILSEWQSVNFQQLTGLEIWLLSACAGMLLLGVRLPWSRLLMVLLLVHMALQHIRHGELLAFVAPLLVAPSVGDELRRRAAGVAVSGIDRGLRALAGRATPSGLAVGAVLLVFVSTLAFAAPVAPNQKFRPAAAVAAAFDHFNREHLVPGRVLNSYVFGGDLIFRGVPTFIDGRADMFGDAFIEREDKAIQLRSTGLPDLLDENHVEWTLFPPKTPAVALLDLLPGWQRLYADDIAIVHVRRPADAAPSTETLIQPAPGATK